METRTAEEKKERRKAMCARLEAYFSRSDGKIDSALAARKILERDEFKSAEVVLAFLAARNEIDCGLVLDVALVAGKTVAVPKVVSRTEIAFFVLNPNAPLDEQVESGAFGIREPVAGLLPFEAERHARESVFAVVPGLSFTERGERLGRGGGFYDRFIRKLRSSGANVFCSGLCFPFQIAPSLPTDGTDERVDCVAW